MPKRLILSYHQADGSNVDLDLDLGPSGVDVTEVDRKLDEADGLNLDELLATILRDGKPEDDEADTLGQLRGAGSLYETLGNRTGALTSAELEDHPDEDGDLTLYPRPRATLRSDATGEATDPITKPPAGVTALAREDWPADQQDANYRVAKLFTDGRVLVSYWSTEKYALETLSDTPNAWVSVSDHLGREFAYRRPIGNWAN